LLDVDLTAVRQQKARERYANMRPEKKAELNAKKEKTIIDNKQRNDQ